MFVAVVKTPPSNLWIMAVLTPLFLLMVVVVMVSLILCKRNRVIFKTGAFRNFKTRSKVKLSDFVVRVSLFLPYASFLHHLFVLVLLSIIFYH